MTAAGRRKISMAQKARWAKVREKREVKSPMLGTIVSVEYQKPDGSLQKVWLRRSTDPRVDAVRQLS